jgi:phage baseplate assembly protein W
VTSIPTHGAGIAHPMTATDGGRLVRSSGAERVMDSIETIWTTPKGSCPMDPNFGVDVEIYEPGDLSAFAWELAAAVERSEPRVEELEVRIVAQEYGLTRVRALATVYGQDAPLSRIINLYGLGDGT